MGGFLCSARNLTKVDWAIRDLAIKVARNLLEYASPAEAKEFAQYLKLKIEQDVEHLVAVYEVKKLLSKKGAYVLEVDMREKLVDLVAVALGRVVFIEVKPTPPPWAGNNPKEHHDYFKLAGKVIYAWRQNHRRWMYCDLENAEERNGKVYAKVARPLEELAL